MEYILCAVAGAALMLGGFFIGVRVKTQKIAPESDLKITDDDDKRRQRQKIDQQYENMMGYTGRRQNG